MVEDDGLSPIRSRRQSVSPPGTIEGTRSAHPGFTWQIRRLPPRRRRLCSAHGSACTSSITRCSGRCTSRPGNGLAPPLNGPGGEGRSIVLQSRDMALSCSCCAMYVHTYGVTAMTPLKIGLAFEATYIGTVPKISADSLTMYRRH